MTREEAIEILKQFKRCLTDVVFDKKGSEAWQMAIQALSQEQKYRMAYDYSDGTVHKFAWIDGGWKEIAVEPYCEDAISREYLFKVLDDFCGHDRTATITLDTLADLVYDLPSVTQKSGKWIVDKGSLDAQYGEVCKCSKCEIESIGESNYCPNCGAKMESEE